jgi:hypothetical protein
MSLFFVYPHFRALMPALTLATRNNLLPDVAKIKKACHLAAFMVNIQLFYILQ